MATKSKVESVALDFAIQKGLESWGGVDKDLLPDYLQKHYNVFENRVQLQHMNLEDKMLFWECISPKNKVFIYFSSDGEELMKADLEYFDKVPASFTSKKEAKILSGVVVTAKNAFKYLQRLAMVVESVGYAKYKKIRAKQNTLKRDDIFDKQYIDFLKMIFFNTQYRLDKACARYGVTALQFTFLIGISQIDDFRIDRFDNVITKALGVKGDKSKLYKQAGIAVKKGLASKMRHSNKTIYEITPKGEDLLTNIMKIATQYEFQRM